MVTGVITDKGLDVISIHAMSIPIELLRYPIGNIMLCPQRRTRLKARRSLPLAYEAKIECKQAQFVEIRGVWEVQSLKNKFVGNDVIFSLNGLVEKKKIYRNVIRAMGIRYSFAKERAWNIFDRVVKANSYDFMKLPQALFGVAPAKIFGEASWAPIFGLGHLQRS